MVDGKGRMFAKNKTLNELDIIYESHKKKHGSREMSDKEVRGLLRL